MLDFLIDLDHSMFQFVNEDLSNPVFDYLMPIIRNKYTWIPFYVGLIAFSIFRFRKEGLQLMLFVIMTVIACDQASASLFKPFFERLRPCRTPELLATMNQLIDCGGGFSFISSHATNHFGIAAFLGLIFRRRYKWFSYALLVWAGLISFAQVYVGVHFPFDVIVGALMGMMIGGYISNIFNRALRKEI